MLSLARQIVATVALREIGTELIGTILAFVLDPPRKIGTRLLGFWRPCQYVLPVY